MKKASFEVECKESVKVVIPMKFSWKSFLKVLAAAAAGYLSSFVPELLK